MTGENNYFACFRIILDSLGSLPLDDETRAELEGSKEVLSSLKHDLESDRIISNLKNDTFINYLKILGFEELVEPELISMDTINKVIEFRTCEHLRNIYDSINSIIGSALKTVSEKDKPSLIDLKGQNIRLYADLKDNLDHEYELIINSFKVNEALKEIQSKDNKAFDLYYNFIFYFNELSNKLYGFSEDVSSDHDSLIDLIKQSFPEHEEQLTALVKQIDESYNEVFSIWNEFFNEQESDDEIEPIKDELNGRLDYFT